MFYAKWIWSFDFGFFLFGRECPFPERKIAPPLTSWGNTYLQDFVFAFYVSEVGQDTTVNIKNVSVYEVGSF